MARTVIDCWNDNTFDPGLGKANIAKIQALECIIQQILQLIVQLAGIAVFLMLIVGGFKYLTAGGDKKATESAQQTITSAIFGLALLLISWFILLLIKEITGVDVTQFIIPGP